MAMLPRAGATKAPVCVRRPIIKSNHSVRYHTPLPQLCPHGVCVCVFLLVCAQPYVPTLTHPLNNLGRMTGCKDSLLATSCQPCFKKQGYYEYSSITFFGGPGHQTQDTFIHGQVHYDLTFAKLYHLKSRECCNELRISPSCRCHSEGNHVDNWGSRCPVGF